MYGRFSSSRICSYLRKGGAGKIERNIYTELEMVKIIMLTCPCHVDPLTPYFYIVKLGLTGVYIIVLFLLSNIDCGYSLEPPHNLRLEQK